MHISLQAVFDKANHGPEDWQAKQRTADIALVDGILRGRGKYALSAEQRGGLDNLTRALEHLQLKDRLRSTAASSRGSAVSRSAGFSMASSDAGSAASSTASRGSKRARRRCQACATPLPSVPGASPNLPCLRCRASRCRCQA